MSNRYAELENPNREVREWFNWNGTKLGLVYKTNELAAKKRGYIWDISKELFLELSQQNCFYCGKEPSNQHASSQKYNGLDRVNNKIGYIPNNVVTCCYTCNSMKGKLSTTEFYNHIKSIIKHSNALA
jgi:hypothetical protein